jgi:coenzyme Q-binding protein COQ10
VHLFGFALRSNLSRSSANLIVPTYVAAAAPAAALRFEMFHSTINTCRKGDIRNVTEQPEVIVVTHVISAPVQDVWVALLSEDAFESQVPDVRRVQVSYLDLDCREVRWKVWLKGFELSWMEHQRVDHVNRRVEFEQREGMFRTHRGRWDVSASSGTDTEVQWRMDFDTGMPHLAHMVNPVIARAFRDLAVDLLKGLERIVTTAVHEPAGYAIQTGECGIRMSANEQRPATRNIP